MKSEAGRMAQIRWRLQGPIPGVLPEAGGGGLKGTQRTPTNLTFHGHGCPTAGPLLIDRP